LNPNSPASRRSPIDGLIEELFRLEGLKLRALTLVDAPGYDDSVRKQLQLLDSSNQLGTEATSVERLLALSQLMRLSRRLLQNLLSTTPATGNSYTSTGLVSDPPVSGQVSMEA
jgi:hypothetical protein